MIWALHGNLGLPGDWETVASRTLALAGGDPGAAPGCEWRMPDLRQLGAGAEESLAGAAREIARLVHVSGDPRPFLAGYSMGGRIALHCLLDDAVPWGGAVIVSAGTGLPAAPGDAGARSERLRRDAEWASLAPELAPEEFLERWNGQALFSVRGGASGDAGHDPESERAEERVAGADRFFGPWSLARQSDLLPELRRIRCPVVWVCGARDTRYAEIGRRAVDVLPLGRLRLVPDAGHRVLVEAPDAVADAILALATGRDLLS